jgi:hypothetical protein
MPKVDRLLAAALLSLIVPASAACTTNVDEPEDAEEAELRATDRLLTRAQERAVLSAIDNVCGDTWCEGDFDFAFKKLDCKRSTRACTFDFEYIHRVYDEGADEPLAEFRIPSSCTFENIRTRGAVMTTVQGQIKYSDHLYELVTECINDNEEDARIEADAREAEFRAQR